jgi:hypothetical protein
LVAQGDIVEETIEIAEDIARILLDLNKKRDVEKYFKQAQIKIDDFLNA